MRWIVLEEDAQILAVHAALVANSDGTGQIIYFGGDEHDEKQHDDGMIDHTRLFDCTTLRVDDFNPHSPTSDVFCCGHAMLPDGRLLVAGGTEVFLHEDTGIHNEHFPGLRNAWIYDSLARKWTETAPLNLSPQFINSNNLGTTGGRWYPTLITVGDGSVLALSGHPSQHDSRHNNHIPERYLPVQGSWIPLFGRWTEKGPPTEFETTNDLNDPKLYPRVHLLPNGMVFCSTPLGKTPSSQVIDPMTGDRRLAGEAPPKDTFTGDPALVTIGMPNGVYWGNFFTQCATSVLLPLAPPNYAPRILICGGKKAHIIDLQGLNDPGANPQWMPTGSREREEPRFHLNAVLMPTGNIFVCGGCRVFNQDNDAVVIPEIYHPETNTWETLDATPASVPRNYHSVALLMPDGRIWTAGSNINGLQGVTKRELRIEIFEPDYFDRTDRPKILLAPHRVSCGETFEVQAPDAASIGHVAIIRTGSVTHSFNSDQRYVRLDFHRIGDTRLSVTAPPNNQIAPPGSYLLFLLNTQGVPSVGKFIVINTTASEILWHNSNTNETQLWFMDRHRISGRATVVAENGSPIFVGPPWSIVGSGDFNRNGTSDILWLNSATGEIQIWFMNNQRIANRARVVAEDGSPIIAGPPWSIVGTGDFNKDGSADILWLNRATGGVQIWFMNSQRIAGRATVVAEDGSSIIAGPPWNIVGTGDFNRNGTADILWQNSATGEIQMWLMNGHKIAGRATVVAEDGSPIIAGPPWSIVGTRDFNRDGMADILWHNTDTNGTQIWFMNGHKIASRATVLAENGSPIFVGLPWSVVMTGDINRKGTIGILWHNSDTNGTQFWFINGHKIGGRATVLAENGGLVLVGLPWSIVGMGDFNRDATADILWHNRDTNGIQIWFMNGHKIAGRATVLAENGHPIIVGPPWSIVGAGDFNRDGTADILWHNSSTNETQIWFMDGHRVAGRATVLAENGSPVFIGLPWSIVGTGDFNRDGTTDILWHNSATNETQIWIMNDRQIAGRVTVLAENGSPVFVGAPWRIVGTGDFNFDMAADILWHNSATNETQIWFMDGHRIAGRATVLAEDGSPIFVGVPWSIVETGVVQVQ